MGTNINTTEYWNNRYEINGSWENNGGIEQTSYWSHIIFNNIPICIKTEINTKRLSIMDVGTGLGQTAKMCKDYFKNSRVIGFDFSDIAIQRCRILYQNENVEFTNQEIKDNVDIVILSNIIEHVENPIDMLQYYFFKTNHYCIILSPYKENPTNLISEHVVSIDENILLENIHNGYKIFEKIINVRNSGFWDGDVVLCVYQVKTCDQ